MNKFLLSTLTLILAISVNAQTSEIVTTGEEYVHDVYYSLENGEVSAESREEWDIAFNVTLQGSSILTNGGKGVELYEYPNGGTEEWNNFDISGWEEWPLFYNSESTWSIGAFDQGAEGFDVGWGTYNPVTHIVTGDALFMVKLGEESFKKVWIEDLTNGVFSYKYADLDGSNEVTGDIVKADYPGKNFVYVSLTSDTIMDREPSNDTWDLVFTRYITFVEIFYPVTGVLSNSDVKILQVNDTPTNDASFEGETFSENITEIGFDWKSFNMEIFQFEIQQDLTYFIQDINGGIWKVIFTGFGGSATGTYEFTKELVGVVGIEENQSITNLGVFPNPTNGNINVVYHADDANETNMRVFDLTGKVVFSQNLSNTNSGLNQESFDLNELNTGIYILELTKNGSSAFQKIIIE